MTHPYEPPPGGNGQDSNYIYPGDEPGPAAYTGGGYGQPGDWPAGSYAGGPEPGPEWDGEPGSYAAGQSPGMFLPPDSFGRGGRARPRVHRTARLLLAAVAVITVVAGIVAAGFALRPHAAGAPAAASRAGSRTPPATAVPPAITPAAARQVLGTYVTANNTANQARSTRRLAQIEGGSSYRLDAGGYQFETVSDPANTGYHPLAITSPVLYIPRLAAAAWPKWFVTEATWTAAGAKVTPVREYDVFAEASLGGPWLNVDEPDLTGAAPDIATGPAGYASAAPADAAGLAVAPGGVAPVTAAHLAGGGPAGTAVTGLASTQDQKDQAFWRSQLPASMTVTVRHFVGGDGVYALRTQDGGALVFYSLGATLTLTPPPGQSMQLNIPGFYSPSDPVSSAAPVPYEDQFAAVVPPRGQAGGVSVVAQLSGIAARS